MTRNIGGKRMRFFRGGALLALPRLSYVGQLRGGRHRSNVASDVRFVRGARRLKFVLFSQCHNKDVPASRIPFAGRGRDFSRSPASTKECSGSSTSRYQYAVDEALAAGADNMSSSQAVPRGAARIEDHFDSQSELSPCCRRKASRNCSNTLRGGYFCRAGLHACEHRRPPRSASRPCRALRKGPCRRRSL